MNASKAKSLVSKKAVGRHAAGHGLYLRVTKEGAGYWVVRYSIYSKRREITIGNFKALTLAQANLEAAKIKLDVSEGIDPLTERKREDNHNIELVDDLAEDWLTECDRRLKHPQIPRQVYRDYIKPSIGEIPLSQISPRDIRAAMNKASEKGSPTRTNDALMYCKQLFRHAVKLDLIQSNPALPFTTDDAGGVEKSRTRILSIEDVGALLKTLRENSNQFARENYLAVVLLLSLGVRKGELVAAQWSEFNLTDKLWHMPSERNKTEVAITIPLSEIAMKCLEELKIRSVNSAYLFPNRRVSKRFGHISPDTLNAALKKMFEESKMPVEHFTVHDLRRTFRSLLASLAVPGHVAERCLNHKLKGVEGIYDRYDYLDERRQALDAISKLIGYAI